MATLSSTFTTAVTAQQGTQQDAQQLMQMATGLMFTAALHPVAKLKIADLLAAGPLPVSELAQKTGTNADALYRVLRMLASGGLFTELPGQVFGPTPVSNFLRSDNPASLRDMVLWVGNKFHFKVWSDLAYSLETGQQAVEHLYGKPAFDVIFGEPDVAYDFNMAMTCFSRQIAPALLGAYDFSGIDTLMDIAGGHGAILCEVLNAYPQMKGILFEVPNVIEEANCHICNLKMDDRCRTISGSFFEGIPAEADAYYMQHIIHDWADEPALRILGHCHSALAGKKGGRLLIVDNVVPENSQPHPSKLLDIEMLLMPGGRERTEREWNELLGNAGFEITRIVPMRAAESIIEARRRG